MPSRPVSATDFREAPAWLRTLRRHRRELWWFLRGRRRYARVVPLDERTQDDLDQAVRRGRELAEERGW